MSILQWFKTLHEEAVKKKFSLQIFQESIYPFSVPARESRNPTRVLSKTSVTAVEKLLVNLEK